MLLQNYFAVTMDYVGNQREMEKVENGILSL